MGSSEYTNIKKSRLITTVNRLGKLVPNLTVSKGSKHYLKLNYPHVEYGLPSFPLAINHNKIDPCVVQELMKWLIKNKICSKERFDSELKR